MQFIHVSLVNENDKDVEVSNINFADVVWDVLWKVPSSKEKYPWLSTIDPYGMTWLNGLQLAHVAEELKNLKSETKNSIHIKTIEDTLMFFKNQSTHKYIKFMGD